MEEIDWNLLKSFMYVVKKGSLSGAARALGSTQPTMGRHIEALEEQLKVPLFIRSREGLLPTDEALNIIPEVEAMESSFGALVRRAGGSNPEEMGTVRISMSEVVGADIIPPIIKKFHQLHRGVHIELSISNRFDNLLKREADIAVRMTPPSQEALISRKIGVSEVGLFAHKSYFDSASYPHSFEDLAHHTLVGPDSEVLFFQVLQSMGIKLKRDEIKIRVDNQIVQQQLIREGVGIGVMQIGVAAKDPELTRVLPKEFEIPMPVSIVMHEDLRSSRRIRLLFDFLAQELTTFYKP